MAKAKKNTHGITKEMCRMITPEFRVSYPHMFKPQAPEGSKPKYSVTMLFPKDAKIAGTTVDGEATTLNKIISNAKTMEFGAKENWPDDLKSCVIDGDLPKYQKNEGYAGHWVVKATSNEDAKPGLVDEEMTPITNPADFYPGCYARAYVYARVWEHTTGGSGVQLILDHVQKLRDGKNFGGKAPVDQVFKSVGKKSRHTEDEDESDEAEQQF